MLRIGGDPGADNDGLTDYDQKVIDIRETADMPDTIIHECAHATSKDISEECVTRIGHAAAGALKAAGLLK